MEVFDAGCHAFGADVPVSDGGLLVGDEVRIAGDIDSVGGVAADHDLSVGGIRSQAVGHETRLARDGKVVLLRRLIVDDRDRAGRPHAEGVLNRRIREAARGQDGDVLRRAV